MGIRERFRKKFGLDQVTEDILNSGIMKAYLQDSGRLTGFLPEKGAPGSTRLQDMARGLGEGIDPLLDLAVAPFLGYKKLYNYLTSPSPYIKSGTNVSEALKIPEMPDASVEDIININRMSRNPDFEFRQLEDESPYTDDDYETGKGMEGTVEQTVQEQLNTLQNDLSEKTDKPTTDINVRSPISPEQELREGEDEQTGVEDDTLKGDDQSDAFTEAMKSIEDISTGEESGVKGLDYYKKQFADATGIDISGKPDTRAATIAFGLALMQNKAGKGFNIGRMLSSVGEAGEKALPLAEAARKEARAAQVSAGTYALQERKAAIADAIDRQQKKVDAVLAIEKEFRGYENQKELEKIKAATKIKVEILKQEAETLKNMNDKKLEFTYKGFEIGAKTEKTPVSTQKEMKVTTGIRKSDGQMVFPFAEQEASQFATGLGQLEKATSTLDEIERNVQSIIDGGGSVTLEKATDIVNNILSALGADYSIYKDEDGKTATGKITTNQILQDRLISQFKRFLTQETGNGISKADLDTVKELIGQVSFFTNPASAIRRIQEVRDIFDTPKQQILTQLEQFADPKKHLNEDAFNNTMKIINDAALGASTFGGQMSFDEGEYTRDDDGNIFIDLTNMAN